MRFTGGEPLLRRELESIIARTAALTPRPEISLTTNGIGLARRAVALREAGLDRINVSLDTLRPEVFRKLARRDRLADVLDALSAAAAAGLTPVKVNAVLMRGINDDEAVPLLRLLPGARVRAAVHRADAAGRAARLEAGRRWSPRPRFSSRCPPRSPCHEDSERARGAAPAETFLVNGGPARVGVIASVTRPFCGSCDRVRLTADGQVRNCLFARSESDLRSLLRGGASDEEIAERWQAAVAVKLPGHGINDPSFLQPDRPMSAIGG